MPVECDTCGGTGRRAGHAPGTVQRRATGTRRGAPGPAFACSASSSRPRPCQTCAGTGQMLPNPCETCRGDGRVHGTRTLDVEVPAGIDDGQRLRLAQRGPAAPRGGVPGDLYVSVRVAARSRVRAPRRRPRPPHAGVDRRRPRSARSSRSRRSTASRRSRSSRARSTARRSGCAASACRRCAPAGAAISCARSRSRCRATSPTEEAELLAQFAALRGEEVRLRREGLFSRIRSAFQ